MPRHHLTLLSIILLLLLGGCGVPEADLLVPVYFYQGHHVGKESPPTGLQIRYAGERDFRTAAWPELITNSVAVDESGRWVYLACGNGVMVSRDGARSFALTGGFRVAEVQKVAIDRRDPHRAWAASAWGVIQTTDGGGTWTPADHLSLFRYCTDVRQDPADPEVLWVGSDRGLFRSKDGGASFEGVLEGVGVRRVLPLPGRILACTDGRGLLESRDDGETFQRVAGPPDVTFCVAVKPGDEDVLLVGTMEGLFVSEDGGESFRGSREGLPEGCFIYGVAVDPADAERIVVSGNRGLFESGDAGRSFEQIGFDGALLPDVAFARLDRTGGEGPSTEPGTLVFVDPDRVYAEHRPEADPAFDERREGLLEHFRRRAADAENWPGWATAAVQVREGNGNEKLWEELRGLLNSPKHSMFFSMPLMGLYLHGRDQLPADLDERIREVMTTNSVYRGDTENHWVMHYTAQLLAAQTWPETSMAQWPAHRTTQELYDEARGWLVHWSQLAAGYGQGEFDSPNYLFMYVTPMLMLYDFAKEPQVKQLAGMMLDLLLADYFVESLQGAYCGGHSRIIGQEVELTRSTRVAVLHHLYAGGIPRPEQIQEWAGFAALSSYRPPEVLSEIANQRTNRIQRERERVRNVIRFGRELNPPVYKTGLMTEVYHLGSLQGGILQPIQQHTWDVTWIGSAENSRLFTVHPSVSAKELGMFFPEEMRDLTNTITAQKGVYGSPDKIISASAFEKISQEGNVLLALYQVPPGERFEHVSMYWPDCLERSESGGWHFGTDGEFWVAVYPTQRGDWKIEDGWRRFRCRGERAGFVVVTREWGWRAVAGQFWQFKRMILDGPVPELTGEGDGLTLTFGEQNICWGRERSFPEAQLFSGPFIESTTGTRVIRLQDAFGFTRTLDFNTFTITETK